MAQDDNEELCVNLLIIKYGRIFVRVSSACFNSEKIMTPNTRINLKIQGENKNLRNNRPRGIIKLFEWDFVKICNIFDG